MQENGLFETILIEKGVILLKDLHFERLLKGMKLLDIPVPGMSFEKLEEEIKHSCVENKYCELCRVRLSVYKDSGFHIETFSLDPSLRNSKIGLLINIYPHDRKMIDDFSNLKSTNYSLFLNAADYAKENGLDDCLLLNNKGNICESSISNVFIVKGNKILTPSLSEGCIEGVMRAWVISSLKKMGQRVNETSISINALETADEIFLTNAIRGVRWVKQFKGRHYKNTISSTILE